MADQTEHLVTTLDALGELYDKPFGPSLIKEIDHVNAQYRAFIEASPFCVLATVGENGVDVSPRGDPAGFVRVVDEKTLHIPDRRGNNRLDSLRNIVQDPRVSVLFLIPGVGETIRVIGRAAISTDPRLTKSFVMNGKTPCTVIVISVERAFFQCTKAIVRSKLWDPATQVDRKSLPSAGTIISAITAGKIDGSELDRTLAERIKATIY